MFCCSQRTLAHQMLTVIRLRQSDLHNSSKFSRLTIPWLWRAAGGTYFIGWSLTTAGFVSWVIVKTALILEFSEALLWYVCRARILNFLIFLLFLFMLCTHCIRDFINIALKIQFLFSFYGFPCLSISVHPRFLACTIISPHPRLSNLQGWHQHHPLKRWHGWMAVSGSFLITQDFFACKVRKFHLCEVNRVIVWAMRLQYSAQYSMSVCEYDQY